MALGRLIGVVWLSLLLGQVAAFVHAAEHDMPARAMAGADDADQGPWGHRAGSSACEVLDHLLGGTLPVRGADAMSGAPPAPGPVIRSTSTAPAGADPLPRVARGPPGA